MRPAVASPRFAITEVALRLLRHAETQLAATSETVQRRPRVLRDMGGATTDLNQWRQEASFFRIVSITESYLDTLSVHRHISFVDSSIQMLMRLVEDVQISSSGTWKSREDAYKFHHDLRLSKCSRWKDIQAAIQVRNCLAHGLGTLTPRQRRNSTLPAQVSSLDVVIGGGRMHLGQLAVSKACGACQEFVRDVDSKMPTRC